MTASAKTVLLLGVAALALSACSGSKGPGELGSSNDIVVRNYGEPRESTPAGDFSSTVETAAAVPPAAVEAGQPVPAADGAVATEAAAQSVDEQTAPVPATTAAPMNDGTPAAAIPEPAQSVAEEPVPAQPVNQPVNTSAAATAPVAPTQTNALNAEPYVQPRVTEQPEAAAQTAAPQTTAAVAPAQPEIAAPSQTSASAPASPSSAQGVYPSSQAPAAAAETVAAPIGEPVAAESAQPVSAPAPVAETPPPVAVPSNPDAPFYDYLAAGQQAQTSGAAISSANTTGAATSGTISRVKAALSAKGLYNGAQNDTVDSEFLNALVRYQGEHGLPMGGINAETLQHLGVAQ